LARCLGRPRFWSAQPQTAAVVAGCKLQGLVDLHSGVCACLDRRSVSHGPLTHRGLGRVQMPVQDLRLAVEGNRSGPVHTHLQAAFPESQRSRDAHERSCSGRWTRGHPSPSSQGPPRLLWARLSPTSTPTVATGVNTPVYGGMNGVYGVVPPRRPSSELFVECFVLWYRPESL
jgi:hypothetical protein